jgi:hypothetical protein
MRARKAPVDFMAGLRSLEDRDGVQRRPRPAPVPALDAAEDGPTATSGAQQRSRRGKVAITQWQDPIVRKQLAQLALDSDKKQAELLAEGLNLLFEKYGKSPIASA